MSNPAPVLLLPGVVRSAELRTVEAREAADAVRDPETGRIVTERREAREAYDAVDLTVLTDEGGFANVVMRADCLGDLPGGSEGKLPDRGDKVDLPVRPYTQWEGRPGRKYPTIRYAVSAEALADRAKSGSSSGPRLAATGS